MVDVVGQVVERDVRLAERTLKPDHVGPVDAAAVQHGGVHRHADHAVALDDRAQDLVRELPLARNERAAVLVRGDHGAVEPVERLCDGRVGGVRGVQHDTQPAHVGKQPVRRRKQPAVGPRAGAVAVGTGVVVREADDAQAGGVELLQGLGVQDRVRAFQPDDHAHRQAVETRSGALGLLPAVQVIGQLRRRGQDTVVPAPLHDPVEGELAPRLRIGQLTRAVAPELCPRAVDARVQLADEGGHAGAALLGDGRHEIRLVAGVLAGHAGRRCRANRLDRLRKVGVEPHRHAGRIVSVEDQHPGPFVPRVGVCRIGASAAIQQTPKRKVGMGQEAEPQATVLGAMRRSSRRRRSSSSCPA